MRLNPTPPGALILSGILAAVIFCGCLSWQPAWQRPGFTIAGTDSSELSERAEQLGRKADSRAALLATIAAYESVLAADGSDFAALTNLGHLYILLGAAYTGDRGQKVLHFQTARQYNEWAMYTNVTFRTLVDKGHKPWEACDVLTRREVPAMFYWVTSVLYHFQEGMPLPQKMLNTRWMRRCGAFLKRIEAIDPDWGGGGVQFSLAIYYGVLPDMLGGDRRLSDTYLARSLEVGPDWLINRWGRAKYFHVRDRNRTAFEEDLQWVLDRDVHRAGGEYAWKVYFQRDAREMLADPRRYFP